MAPADLPARARQTAAARRAGALLLAACCALSAACSPFGSAEEEAAAPPLSTAAPAAGQTLVAGTGPQPSPPAPVPAATVTQDTTSFVTVTRPAPPAKTVTGGDEGEMCADLVSRSVVGVGVAAVATQGSVQLSWMSRKGASLEGWRVAAARQDLVSGVQPPLVWKDVPAPPGCQLATTTITGLASGSRYQFWLHTVLTDPLGGDPTVVMVGRSPVVDVP